MTIDILKFQSYTNHLAYLSDFALTIGDTWMLFNQSRQFVKYIKYEN